MKELLKAIKQGTGEIVLRKDLVIPAGTVFTSAPKVTKRKGSGHYIVDFGLSKDSSGTVEYSIDVNSKDVRELLDEWFLVL